MKLPNQFFNYPDRPTPKNPNPLWDYEGEED